jgi:hypothetical protein
MLSAREGEPSMWDFEPACKQATVRKSWILWPPLLHPTLSLYPLPKFPQRIVFCDLLFQIRLVEQGSLLWVGSAYKTELLKNVPASHPVPLFSTSSPGKRISTKKSSTATAVPSATTSRYPPASADNPASPATDTRSGIHPRHWLSAPTRASAHTH